MKPHIKQIIIGFIVGLLANAAGTFLYIFFFSEHDLEQTLQLALAFSFS